MASDVSVPVRSARPPPSSRPGARSWSPGEEGVPHASALASEALSASQPPAAPLALALPSGAPGRCPVEREGARARTPPPRRLTIPASPVGDGCLRAGGAREPCARAPRPKDDARRARRRCRAPPPGRGPARWSPSVSWRRWRRTRPSRPSPARRSAPRSSRPPAPQVFRPPAPAASPASRAGLRAAWRACVRRRRRRARA
eukprot:scaffold18916_cov72-Isochrysis_galbana.AAC.2